jgi:hypothetical protein
MKNQIKKAVALCTLAAAMAACAKDVSLFYTFKGKEKRFDYVGRVAGFANEPFFRHMELGPNNNYEQPFVEAEDYDMDGKFDYVRIAGPIVEGSPIQDLVRLDKIEEMRNIIIKYGSNQHPRKK